ncbi:protein GrpE [Algimonas arctica]|uniref:Protein GrpE n=1 Tax=Algimonas arctica TaxID=1479486 RepID=A0A8J3CRQ5_9PROT|nr:nucleotide exchange factor GrpE [Algimonas arctica]GHA95993.1 protein GrpE [Algimonas arctica]
MADNTDNGNGDMDEWDALQAQIEGESTGQSGRADAPRGNPSPADLKATADAFLKKHKNDVLSDDEDDMPFPESEMDADEAGMNDAGAAKIQELEMQIATMKDQALRTMAEADNIRKRAERDVQKAKVYGVEKFATDVLSVYDNLSRALQTLDGQAKEELGDNARHLVEGIELTEKDLTSALLRHQIKPVAGLGSKFDPNVHQAVANIPHPEIEKGHVAAVMQQGFTIGDRTLRAAMVAVSTGPAG